MGIQVALRHRTIYRYDRPVSLGPQIIRLRPGLHCRTPILSYSLDVTPSEHSLKWQLDPSSNQLARLVFQNKTSEFGVDVNLVADLSPINPFEFLLDPAVEEYPFKYGTELAGDLHPYLMVSPLGTLLRTFVESCRGQRTGTVNLLLTLNRKVRDEVSYVTRLEHGIQTPEETIQKRSGSCRDSALLLVECLRNLGIAARFVSGYLIQLAEAKAELNGSNSGPKADSADLHAWAEAFLPGAGWIGLDPTSGFLAGDGGEPDRFVLVGLDDDEGVVSVVEVAEQLEQGVLGRVVDVVAVLAVGAVIRSGHRTSLLVRRSQRCQASMARGVAGPDGSQPLVDRSDVDGGLEADREFVEPGGDGPVPLQTVDSALDRVTGLVVLAVESRRPASRTSSSLAVRDLVGRFRDRATDAASAQVGPVRAR